MRLKFHSLAAVAALVVGSAAMAECQQPQLPKIADGASATVEVMVQSQQAVKQYLSEGDSYLKCLKGEEQAAIAAAQKAGVKPDSDAAAALLDKRQAITKNYNAAVDAMQSIGDRFNVEIRKYKAAHAKG